MKYVNYCLLIVALFLSSFWIFNHIHAWLGIGFGFVIIYFLIYRAVQLTKVKQSEKS